MYVFYQAVKYDMATNGSDVPMFISGLQSTDQNTCITNLQRNYTTHDQAKNMIIYSDNTAQSDRRHFN